MNRKLLPSLIALMTVGAAGVVNAADNIPTVYGKVNVTLNNYKFDSIASSTDSYKSLDNWKLESNASRIGVKGDYDISGELKAIYKLEFEVYPDGDSSSNVFGQRNTYAGLQGGWGTLFAGKNDTPLKAIAAETVQLFKDLPLGDFKYVMVGENRPNNIIQYATPKMSGFIFSLQVAPGEQTGSKGSSGTGSTKNTNHGLVDTYSAALTYNTDGVYLAIADDQNQSNTNTVRAVGQFDIGPVKLGALAQQAKRDNSTIAGSDAYIQSVSGLPGSVKSPIADFGSDYEKQDAYALSAAWKIDAWTLKGQYAQSTSKRVSNLSDTKAKNYALGVDYALNKNAKVFAYYAAIDTDGDSSVYDGKLKDKTVAVGWEFKF
ncbi:MAG TPA: porin [Spongiibacteraceae bacterium]|nr:porin [Spongiibacteraceae bacterium]